MKASVIKVGDMLSVSSPDEVERIGEVSGADSVIVDHAAQSATVRFDETRLAIADIKASVRQRRQDSVSPAVAAESASRRESAPPSPDSVR